MTTNPFKPAEQVAPKVKCLIYGPSGVGKTYLALTSPGPVAVIDTEGGTAFYAGREGLAAFDVLPTKTFDDVTNAITYLAANPGSYETLVIDPVTVLWETLQDAAQVRRARVRNDRDADLEMLDWNQIKRAYKTLMTDLINLPIHVIVTARERDETVKQGREFVKVGLRPDAEKGTGYYFDLIVRLAATKTTRTAIIEKDRTGAHPLLAEVKAPTFDKLFGKAIAARKDATGERGLQSDHDAAERDAETTFADGRTDDHQETLTPLGVRTATGVVKKGDGRHSDTAVRQMPDGAHFAFRLETDAGKRIPQVCVEGPLGGALMLVTGNNPASLLGQTVTVTGEVSTVSVPGRRDTHRMRVDRLETADWTLPAPAGPTETPAEPTEAPSEPLPFDMAAVDAETLDPEGRLLIAGGLPE